MTLLKAGVTGFEKFRKMMYRNVILILMCGALLYSCSNETIDKSDPLASGRGFIESTLKGDYVKAEKYLLKDSTNKEYFDGMVNFNSKLTKLERESYRNAAIIIDSTKHLSDSVDVIYYYNTYKKKPTQIRVVRKDKDWLVDFKYSFLTEPADTLR